ncbi:MAG: hypothetical protein WBA93_01260 [Microcoleaceae cyanobacterium]
MEMYVQSCGFSVDDDYRWLKVNADFQQPEIPLIMTRLILTDNRTEVRITDLIQSEAPSLVLARNDGELFLLVTGLESRERQDFRGRKIRNSVALVCQDSEENELFLRAISVAVLRGKLEGKIDSAVAFGGEYGFQVNFDQIQTLLSEDELRNINSIAAKQDYKIGKNSSELKAELADELAEYSLPLDNRILVVVTGIKKESTLMQAGVWRGLSNLLEVEGWKKPYKKRSSFDEAVKIFHQTQPEKKTINQKLNQELDILLTSSFIFLIGLLLLSVLLYQSDSPPRIEKKLLLQM